MNRGCSNRALNQTRLRVYRDALRWKWSQVRPLVAGPGVEKRSGITARHLLPDIRFGTERHPDKVARRLRTLNIGTWMASGGHAHQVP